MIKKNILIILFLIFSNFAFSNINVSIVEGASGLVYENGKETPYSGIYQLYHPEKKFLISEQVFKNGLLKEETRYDLENGKITDLRIYEGDGVVYKNSYGKLNKDYRVYSIRYHNNGNKQNEGLWSHYSDSNGRIGAIGVHKIYYPNGSLWIESNHIDSQNVSEKRFRLDGSIESESSYIDLKRNGIFKYYDENGKLMKIKVYRNDIEIN